MLLLASAIFSQVVPDGYYVDGYDYPLHNKGYDAFGNEIIVLEFIDPEINNLYPGYATNSPVRGCSGPYCGAPDTVSNRQDVGAFNDIAIHIGEDKNIGSGTDDAGEEISVIANGEVAAILLVNNGGGPLAFGWMMVVRHYEPDGTFHHSTYKHITTLDSISGGICMSEAAFTVQVGDWVLRGQPIARIATGFTNPSYATHLHLEMRDTTFYYTTPASLYERDNGRHSYGGFVDCVTPCSNSGLHFAGYMDSSQVRIAYDNMQRDGILDPSDFIENHRPSTYSTPIVAPEIEWQNTITGNDYDILSSIDQTSDGGYILVGQSNSNALYDKEENCLGIIDYWIIKLDASGNIVWQNTIGGNQVDAPSVVRQTNDGGYIVGGYTYSSENGDVSEIGLGGPDIWIVKLNVEGTIEWQNTIGGSNNDLLTSIEQTSDGGYIVGVSSRSNTSEDKNEVNIGLYDYWILKLDGIGNIIWQNTIGGTGDDQLTSICQTNDSGYILGGFSDSGISGDKSEVSYGGSDYWVLKLNQFGNIEWQNTIGGDATDFLYSTSQTSDGGYILGGYSNSSISGDKTEANIGDLDYWIIKLNSTGIIEWQNTIGGTGQDAFTTLHQTQDDGYILGGFSSSSISGDKTESNYASDYWIVKTTEEGVLDWQTTIGGTGYDYLSALQETSDGGYILGGYSASDISGDKTETLTGTYDFWIVKLFGNCTPTTEICNSLDDNCDGLVDNGVSESISISAGGPTTFCQGGSVVLTATYSGTSIQWKKDGVDIAGAINPTYTATVKATYTATTTSLCGSNTSSGIFVNVNKNPTAAIIAGGATTFCAGGSVTLTANAGAGLSYQWYKGATAIAGATSINYVATTTGNYKCRVTKTATGCFKNSNAISVSVTCKSDGNGFENISIYPNPASSYLEIHFDETISDTYIVIVNSLGQIVWKELVVSVSTEINISSFANGLYTINLLQNGNVIHSEKIIIE